MGRPTPPTPNLGDLERQIMDILWDAGVPLTARQVLDSLRPGQALAYTTVATVLGNLTRKGLAVRAAGQRVHRFCAEAPRSAYIAGLMHDALAGTDNRETAFMHFVRESSADDLVLLRRLLDHPESLGAGTDAPEADSDQGVVPQPQVSSEAGVARKVARQERAPRTSADARGPA